MFYGTGLAACILVLRDKKRVDKAGKVLVVDASDLFRKGRNQNTLEPEHVQAIETAISEFTDELGRSHVTTLDEIRRNEGNLNISLYVQAEKETAPTLTESLTALECAQAEVLTAEAELRTQLAQWGLL